MGKAEVRRHLYVFLERGAEHAYEELRPLSVVRLGFLPGNRFTKVVFRRIVLGRIKEVEMSVKSSLALAMDYSEEIARGREQEADKYRRKFLESDILYTNYEGDRKDEMKEVLTRRFDEMAREMVPLVRADTDSFWEAMRESYAKQEAMELVAHHFSFVEKVVDEFGDGVSMTFSLGPFVFDYTDEALRVLPIVERRLRYEILDELDEEYGSRYEVVASERASKAVGEARKRRAGTAAGNSEPAETAGANTTSAASASGSDTDKQREEIRRRVESLKEERGELRRRVERLEDEKKELRRRLNEGGTNGESELRERLKEAKKENEELRRRLEEERARNEELREKLEKKEDEEESYSAEDWLG